MAQTHPSARERDRNDRDLLHGSDSGQKDWDLEDLREENAQLRQLVIQLSKLVIRNVVERK